MKRKEIKVDYMLYVNDLITGEIYFFQWYKNKEKAISYLEGCKRRHPDHKYLLIERTRTQSAKIKTKKEKLLIEL